MTVSLGNINLFVRDVEASLVFYTDGLGLTLDEERSELPDFALLKADNCTLTLQSGDTPGALLGPSDSVEIGFAVDDVTGTGERLQSCGAEVGEAQQMGWGIALDARTPDGHRLTVYKMRR